ncbi:MAG: glycosyltransferase family 39 protein [Elusimicrobia bacterium]|nr:glycosyltransferase family 39 protein [Elusimicrobiota bacterium]
MRKHLPYFLVPILLLIFYVRIVSTVKVKSDTYDELKCLKAGENLTAGAGWKVEASVFHPPLSYYIHGFLLKDSYQHHQVDKKVFDARLIMAFFPVILGFFIYRYTKYKFGLLPGLLALFLFTFSPNIIAFSCLIVPDMLVALFIFLGFYSYEKALEKSHKRRFRSSFLAGVVFGLALLSKYTGVFLIPIYIVLGLRKLFLRKIKPGDLTKRFLTVCIVGLFVLNFGYKFNNSFKPLNSFSFESRFFSKISKIPVLSGIPMPVPAPFVYGFDIQKHITEAGHPTFLNGRRSTKGWWYYFIVAFLIKVPIPFLILLIFTVFFNPSERQDKIDLLIPVLVLTLPFILFTKSNPGLRYLLPVFPFLFIYVSSLSKVFDCSDKNKDASDKYLRNRSRLGGITVICLLIWFGIESISIHPHYIAYFNQFIGGPENGYKYLADSNIDWGQDRFLVIKFSEKNPDVKLNPSGGPEIGRFLINVNNLQDVFCIEEKHRWLKQFKPVGNIGYSWLLYDVSLQDYENLLRKNTEDYYSNYLAGFVTNDKRYLKKSLELNPQFVKARLKLGLIYMNEKKYSSAVPEFLEVLKSEPWNQYAYKYLTDVYRIIGNINLSDKYRRKHKIAKILSSYVVDVSTSADFYKKAIEKNPEDAKYWNNLGFVCWMNGDLEKAVFNFRKAYEISPNFVDYLGNLAAVYKDKKEQNKYQELYNEYMYKYNLLTTARVSQIRYGTDWMILEDVLILPLNE